MERERHMRDPQAMVAIDQAARETGYSAAELMRFMADPNDIDALGWTDGHFHFLERHCIEKLKRRRLSGVSR